MNKIRRWWQGWSNANRLRIMISLVLAVVAIVLAVYGASSLPSDGWAGLFLNLGTELAGAVVTFALIDWFIGSRERREAEEKQREIQQTIKGSHLEHAKTAEEAHRIFSEMAVSDLLRGVTLIKINLQGFELGGGRIQELTLISPNMRKVQFDHVSIHDSTLFDADLRDAILSNCNLQGLNMKLSIMNDASLENINLQDAQLETVFMRGTDLVEVDLRGANMRNACLEGTVFFDAKLQGVDFEGANLLRAEFLKVEMDGDTKLPDGKHYDPELGLEQLVRFCDPEHPEFFPVMKSDHIRETQEAQ